MEIYIARNGQRMGPFSVDEVRRQIGSGTALPTDLAWAEGSPAWLPISALPELGMAPAAIPIPPPPTPMVIYHPGQTSSTAVASLVFGILSISFLPIVASIPAIVCGHIARREIRTSGGVLTGDAMAVAGLVMGYVYCCLLTVGLLLWLIIIVFLGIAIPFLNQLH